MNEVEKAAQAHPEEVVTSYGAAALLHEALPEKPGYWASFLVNNRRPERNPAFRLPYGRRTGVVIYRRSDLHAFIEFEKRRRLTGQKFEGRAAEVMVAYGIGTPGGGAYGKKLDYRVAVQENEGGRYVQMVVQNPLQVFYIPAKQVRQLAADFARAARQMPKVAR